jgi:hypothetical protein
LMIRAVKILMEYNHVVLRRHRRMHI